MIHTSEYCAVGHPDRTCDYIASYLLDRYLEKDRNVRFALEVQLKDNFCTVSGEVTSKWHFTTAQLEEFVRAAVRNVGYTKEYQTFFGSDNIICDEDLDITFHISQQSSDIAQGVDQDGWGDQGIFFGMAANDPINANLPRDYSLARLIGNELYERRIEGTGIDIKTMVTVDDGKVIECVVAIPIEADYEMTALPRVNELVHQIIGGDCKVIINGTGRYVKHGPVGDCGTTGRKLVVDFYGSGCQIGGGSPWCKDPSKADVTLNVYARMKALRYMKEHFLPFVKTAISCCIGKPDIRISYFDAEGHSLEEVVESRKPSEIIEELGLYYPGYADRCQYGLFGYESV